jgi:hypothetical protein
MIRAVPDAPAAGHEPDAASIRIGKAIVRLLRPLHCSPDLF